MCHTAICPVRVNTPSAVAWIRASEFVTMRSRRPFHRSIKTPITDGAKNIGDIATKPMRPRSTAEPVRR